MNTGLQKLPCNALRLPCYIQPYHRMQYVQHMQCLQYRLYHRIHRTRPHNFKHQHFNHGFKQHRQREYSRQNNHQNNYRNYSTFPRPTSIIRAWGSMAAFGAGAVSYIGYKLNETADKYIPEPLKKAFNDAKHFLTDTDWVDWMERLELGFSMPDINGSISLFEDVDLADYFDVSKAVDAVLKVVDVAKVEMEGQHHENRDVNKTFASSSGTSESASASTSGQSSTQPDTAPSQQEQDAMMNLTKKLIEIRNLLKQAQPTTQDTTTDVGKHLNLPSIVVIGSQSSGKSSVLEAIVGQDFLPKGSNMVTRRPIELTLIHTPDSTQTYGEFPQLGLKHSDFSAIRQTLFDLNIAVPASECISNDPIELRIYSKNVPDLALVDLPGYIAVHAEDQPPELRGKISELCDKYIKAPNIILAVCAADVDLANSEALRAARLEDPKGERTIGVVTKMDLVPPEQGRSILRNRKYPLKMGYVGVMVGKHSKQNELQFFRGHQQFKELQVGIDQLKSKLISVLERTMSSQITTILYNVEQELEEVKYEFKVHFNDRYVTPDAYLAETMDLLKARFREVTLMYNKTKIKDMITKMLEDQMVDVVNSKYYSQGDTTAHEFRSQCGGEALRKWSNELENASYLLSRSGVGRKSTQLVVDSLSSSMTSLLQKEPFTHHPQLQQQITSLVENTLKTKFYSTMDQVENCIKPFKYDLEVTEGEWNDGQKRALEIVESELKKRQKRLVEIKKEVGKRKLRKLVNELQHVQQTLTQSESVDNNTTTSVSIGEDIIPPSLKSKAQEAERLQWEISTLKSRVMALKSKQCQFCPLYTSSSSSSNNGTHSQSVWGWFGGWFRKDNQVGDANALFGSGSTSSLRPTSTTELGHDPLPPCYTCCPEIYLTVLTTKLSSTAVLFLHYELLSDFFHSFPRMMDTQLGMSQVEKDNFAKEDPKVKKQIVVGERKRVLEECVQRLRDIESERDGMERRTRGWV